MHRMMTSQVDPKPASKKKMTPELTLDDIHSYTLQLKGDDDYGSSYNMNSTDGLMGSTGSIMGSLSSCSSTRSIKGGGSAYSSGGTCMHKDLNYENLRANMTNHELQSAQAGTCMPTGTTGSSKDINSNSEQHEQTSNDWEYPGEEYIYPELHAASPDHSPPLYKRRASMSNKLISQVSTRVLVGDDKDSDYQR